MKVILVLCFLFVHALARPGIFGEDGLVHKAVEKAHEAGQKVHETLHNAKVKVTEDILILEGKVHNTVYYTLASLSEAVKGMQSKTFDIATFNYEKAKVLVVNLLKNEESEKVHEKHDDTKPHESKNVEDTENTSEKATNHNTDNTLHKKPDASHQIVGYGKVANDNTENSFDFDKINKLSSNKHDTDNTVYKKTDVNHQITGYGKVANDNTENSFNFDKINKLSSNNHNTDNTHYKKPDVNHQIVGYGKVADDNTENSFDFDKISKLSSTNDHRGTVNQVDGNRNYNDDGTDQFHVVYDQNGKAIVVPNTDNSNTHSNMRYGTSVNHFNKHNSFPVNHDLYDDNKNIVEKQPNYELKRTEYVYIDRTAAARSSATARNSGSIDVRNG